MAGGADAGKQALYRDADKYCKQILSKLSGHRCGKALAVLVIAMVVGILVVPNIEGLDLEKLSASIGL